MNAKQRRVVRRRRERAERLGRALAEKTVAFITETFNRPFVERMFPIIERRAALATKPPRAPPP